MGLASAVEADRDREPETREELAIVVGQHRAVRRDGEANLMAALAGESSGELRHAPNQGSIDQRLAAEK